MRKIEVVNTFWKINDATMKHSASQAYHALKKQIQLYLDLSQLTKCEKSCANFKSFANGFKINLGQLHLLVKKNQLTVNEHKILVRNIIQLLNLINYDFFNSKGIETMFDSAFVGNSLAKSMRYQVVNNQVTNIQELKSHLLLILKMLN